MSEDQRRRLNIHYSDVHIVEDDEEASQFRYGRNDEPVEIGTPVGYDRTVQGSFAPWVTPDVFLVCFDGIYFQSDE